MILIIIIPFVYMQKLRHERLKNLPKVRSQLLRDGARTLVHRETSTPRKAEQGTLSLQEGQAPAGWGEAKLDRRPGVAHRKPSREWTDAEY